MKNTNKTTTVLDTRFNTIDLSNKDLRWIDLKGDEELFTEVSQYIRKAIKEEFEEIYQTIWNEEEDGAYEGYEADIITYWDGHNFVKKAFDGSSDREYFVNPEILKVIESEDAYSPDYALFVDHYSHSVTLDGQKHEVKRENYYILISGTCRQADFPKIKKISKMDAEDFTLDYLNEEGL